MIKLGIIGSRTFNDYELMQNEVSLANVDCIVSGGARGADSLGKRLAEENNIFYLEFLPDYATHGKKAPFLRNTQIVEASDVIIAFWDGKSTGTLDALKKAKKLGKEVVIVLFDQDYLTLEF